MLIEWLIPWWREHFLYIYLLPPKISKSALGGGDPLLIHEKNSWHIDSVLTKYGILCGKFDAVIDSLLMICRHCRFFIYDLPLSWAAVMVATTTSVIAAARVRVAAMATVNEMGRAVATAAAAAMVMAQWWLHWGKWHWWCGSDSNTMAAMTMEARAMAAAWLQGQQWQQHDNQHNN